MFGSDEPYLDGELGNGRVEVYDFKDDLREWASSIFLCIKKMPDIIKAAADLA